MIKLLSEDIRNKISAGEVVERPASVVKELIENSIDANATKISIVVEKGGQQLIQVTDDGCGIPETELSIAFDRYTTSKIEILDDLFAIDTLGFRGEALASIASVSEVNILSANGSGNGFEMAILNGKTGHLKPAPDIPGTVIIIRNLKAENKISPTEFPNCYLSSKVLSKNDLEIVAKLSRVNLIKKFLII